MLFYVLIFYVGCISAEVLNHGNHTGGKRFSYHDDKKTFNPRNHTEDKRITYGYDTNIWDARYYAYLWCAKATCGATLLTTTRAVTAAHCVYGCVAKDTFIYMGMNSYAEIYAGKAYRYGLSAIYIHPYYPADGKWEPTWDVAVLYINGAVTVTNTMGPINYALSRPPLNNYIMCLGYGRTETGQPPAKLKRSWFLTKRYENNMIISNAEQTSVLPGDSGGPCIFNNQFVGDICMYSTIDNGKTFENGALMPSEVLSFYRSHGL